MKCKHCGGEQFVGHQLVRMDILVDGNGDYIDAVHPEDPGIDIYDSEAAYGPFQCCGCGAEYDALADGEDSISGPIVGWTWEDETKNDQEDCKSGNPQVYAVIEERDMSGFSDHGEPTPDYEKVLGIYSTKEKALAEVDKLTAHNAHLMAEFGCDECRYWAAPYTVQ